MQLVGKHYPWFMPTYLNLSAISRADSVRYLYMHRYGGAKALQAAAAYYSWTPQHALHGSAWCPIARSPMHTLVMCTAGMYADLDVEALRSMEKLLVGHKV